MPRLDTHEVARLRASVDFYALVSQVCELTPAAGPGEYLGLCPFHEDRRASLSVNAERGIFHCFACGVGGDVVDFVMRIRGCPFREAVSFLAESTGGLTPPESRRRLAARPPRPMTSDPRLLELLERAAGSYHWALADSDAGAIARGYLAERGVSAEIASTFRLGLSAAGGHFLHPAAVKRGFSGAELCAAGLARKDSAGRVIDHFSSARLLFPISDAKGNVRGFSGRSIDGAEPKYFNCRTSAIFVKGRLLFGQEQAASAIAQAGRVIVCEGFFDAVALSAHGFAESVSVMGIAMTEHQAAQLAQMAVPIYVAYDGDDGGARTAPRALERLAKAGAKDVFLAQLPAGDDPASLLAERGGEAFAGVLAEAAPIRSGGEDVSS